MGAVVLSGGLLLLVRRGRDPQRGLWSIPGGKLEHGETLAEAVEREVLEETGLTVRCGRFIGFAELIGPRHHFVVLDFWASPPEHSEADSGVGQQTTGASPHSAVQSAPKLTAGGDASDAIWTGAEQLDRLPLVDGLGAFLRGHGVLSRLS
ncbi:MAG: NUDIX domain-containing protein [Actinomycetota bacterium]|nr:NUDIX domain-containing protein [Actinomycetota bacterium]